MTVGVPERFRDRVALVEAGVFGVAGVVAALLGPWPWLVAAGPVIAGVVLVVATRQRRRTPRPAPSPGPPDSLKAVARLVREWAAAQIDDARVRGDADAAVRLGDEVEMLEIQLVNAIERVEPGPAREARAGRLGRITESVTGYVETYTSDGRAPGRGAEWNALRTRLQMTRDLLRAELDQRV